jgi:ribosome maturation factor RimP
MSKIVENKIVALITDDLDAAGYDLVRVHISGGGKYAALQIMAERHDGMGMTVEDCAAISKFVSARLETDKDLADRYDLEVSSPGIDRPLTRVQDYLRFQGHIAKVSLEAPIDGQKKFEGKILEMSDDTVAFHTEKGILKVPFSVIENAKLVLTDALMKAAKDKVNR